MSVDDRNIYLNEVGIKDIHYPLRIKGKDNVFHSIEANISLFVDLASHKKGVHMSRFIEIINENRDLDINNIEDLMMLIRERLQAKYSYINISFKYFVEKISPITNKPSLLDVQVVFEARLEDKFSKHLKVITPITTLCPCSKEISNFSAHNQRADVSIKLKSEKDIWIEDLVDISEKASSSPLYSLLKRPDEKFVTEQAYLKPRFVEDVCREVKLSLDEKYVDAQFIVEVQSYESIHNHIAYAKVVKYE